MADLAVGDVLTTVEQLDACPTGTIIRSNRQVVAVAEDAGQVRPWAVVGDTSPRESGELLRRDVWGSEWEVVWVPPITRIEWETVLRNGSVDLPPEGARWLDPFNGSRVRVTVEKVGPDHE